MSNLRQYAVTKLQSLFDKNDLPHTVFYDEEYHTLDTRLIDIIIKNIEISIYNSVVVFCCKNNTPRVWDERFKDIYKFKFISIYKNLDPESSIKNKSFFKRLLFNEKHNGGDLISSEFDNKKDIFEKIKYIPDMDCIEIFPENYTEYCKERHEYFVKMNKEEDVNDSIIQCGKCRSWKVTYYEMQTRSADEPATVFCYCTKCKNRWRM